MVQLKSASGAICTLSLSFNNDGPLGTFFRYICDHGTYIARYDDLIAVIRDDNPARTILRTQMSRAEKWICQGASVAGMGLGFGMAAWAYSSGVPAAVLVLGVVGVLERAI